MNAPVGTRGLDVAELTVNYGQKRAVDRVSFRVDEGEILALLGPSGCGKSTLLRAIAGLEFGDGRISWAGSNLAGVPSHLRKFSLMFQDGQLFKSLNVADNVGYGLRALPRAHRPGRVAIESRVRELLETVGLHGMGERGVATLSGGEQQRVALARALAPSPRMVLLDEPLSSLDRGMRERLIPELREILQASRTSALFVTHDHDEAFTIADRIAIMGEGELLQVGTAAEILRHPADRAVAGFLGLRMIATSELPRCVWPLRASQVVAPMAEIRELEQARWIGVHAGSWEVVGRGIGANTEGVGARVLGGVFHRGGFRIEAEVADLGRFSMSVDEEYLDGEDLIVRLRPSMVAVVMS